MIYFSAISLGCAKNLVDTEILIGKIFQVSKDKITYLENPKDKKVEFLLINTCGFLSSARKEAEEILQEYDKLGKKIILTGCYLPVKDPKFLKKLKNLYKIIYWDEKNLEEILIKDSKKDLEEKISRENLNFAKQKSLLYEPKPRFLFNQNFGYEYLKIAEGCENTCTFCIIPKIRGKQNSKTMENILNEVKFQLKNGVKEIQIIAQDTARYGIDLYGESRLIELLEKIDKIKRNFKFRVYYLNPNFLNKENILKLKKLEKLVPYFDIPFQHVNDKILKKMGRNYDKNQIIENLKLIRKNFTKCFIHTNFMVGFPGETDENFAELCDFVKNYEIESISVFGYHDEELASSSKLKSKVENSVITKRLLILNSIAKDKYFQRQNSLKGKSQIGYIEGGENGILMIRNLLCAPEIDYYDYVRQENLISGKIEIGGKVRYKLDLELNFKMNFLGKN